MWAPGSHMGSMFIQIHVLKNAWVDGLLLDNCYETWNEDGRAPTILLKNVLAPGTPWAEEIFFIFIWEGIIENQSRIYASEVGRQYVPDINCLGWILYFRPSLMMVRQW